MTVILDPRWPKERLARVGRDASFAWLKRNGIRLPDRVYLNRDDANIDRMAIDDTPMFMSGWLGVYQRTWKGGWNAVAVDVVGCHTERRLKVPGRKSIWQAPGAPCDFTPFGVFCHEVGHHVDYTLDPDGCFSASSDFADVIEHEEDISTCEHTVQESFAEAIRLFVSNPDLLCQGRPERYEYLTKKVGLKPLHDMPWRVVLRNAGKRVLASTEAWLAP